MRIGMFCLLPFVPIFFSCHAQQAAKEENKETPRFEMVSIPNVLTNPEERAAYLVEHYWDKFDFADTTLTHLPEVTEQALADYINLMQYVSAETASSSMKGMMKKAEVDRTMFSYFVGMYEKYLYDPNSPMRNESLYIYVLEAILQAPVLDEVEKIRPAHLLELALKNRVGEPAADFTYTLANGENRTLYQTEAGFLLLFFNNPDCHTCKEVTDRLAASSVVDDWMKNRQLKILAIYPDEDLEAWRNHLAYMPSDWINSYDGELTLKNDEVYDLKAIPTLYLLDRGKKVLLKDVTFEQLEAYLQQQTVNPL